MKLEEIKIMYLALLTFGVAMIALSLKLISTQSYSDYYSIGRSNSSGTFGFCLLIFGILVAIVAGILIERDWKKEVKT